MVEKKLPTIYAGLQTNTQFMPQNKSTKSVKFKDKRKKAKQFFRKQVVDEGALLLAFLAVGVAGVAVYFFFTMGFFPGVIALVIASVLLYFLFKYLEY